MKTLNILTAALMLVAVTGSAALAAGQTHKVVIQVSDNDPKKMNIALNNIQNLAKYYESKGDTVIAELVAYGPGLNMYRADKSPVKSRLSTMSLEMKNVKFSACGNTHRKMSKKAGKDIALVSEATKIPSGVVRIIELQSQGYAYIRP